MDFFAGIRVKGNVVLPENAPSELLPNSCLTISIQEKIVCGPIPGCIIPIIANKTFRKITVNNRSVKYDFTIPRIKEGLYIISAVINVGWCKINSTKTKDLIHTGDYHSVDVHDFVVYNNTKVITENINVEILQEEEVGKLFSFGSSFY